MIQTKSNFTYYVLHIFFSAEMKYFLANISKENKYAEFKVANFAQDATFRIQLPEYHSQLTRGNFSLLYFFHFFLFHFFRIWLRERE